MAGICLYCTAGTGKQIPMRFAMSSRTSSLSTANLAIRLDSSEIAAIVAPSSAALRFD